ncbi:MAG TPA: metallophosphoesterase, partial [Aliiroseovarius sp.]|nr:metallophosphoesterase [Aliiroseovarius sp.]
AHFHRLSYDPDAAVALMQAAGLTQGYERTMTTGIWPSEDVLPPALRRQEFMS